jgi:hypothetical protein
MKWIASRTTIPLFDYLVIRELKSKLKQQRATQLVFLPGKQKGRIEGILFLTALIALLFIPLMVMSSRETTSIRNPINVATAGFGISGLPIFYQNQIIPRNLTLDQREQLNSSELSQFKQSPIEQLQMIDLPFGSMLQWTISSDAIQSAANQSNSSFLPYGSLALMMSNATTSNRVQTVTIGTLESPLNESNRQNLFLALDGNETSLFLTAFLPMFVRIGYDQIPKSIESFMWDIEFRFVKNGMVGAFWEMRSMSGNREEIPKFMKETENVSKIVVWSEKVPNEITGSMLASTGGILGLYSFVLLTIGQWISSWVKSLFTELWLTRMVNPQKLLNIVLALEAYELLGELDKEFELAELLLENLRFTGRVVQMINVVDHDA